MSFFGSLAAFSALLGSPALPPDTHVFFHGKNQPFCVERNGISLCFAPGTSLEYVNKVIRRLPTQQMGVQFEIGARWTTTTTNGNTGSRGNPITLTYSFVPDGTALPNAVGEPVSNCNINSVFNGVFPGGSATWKDKVRVALNQWAAFGGLTYTEVSDDGAALPGGNGRNTAPIRGDIRISGHFIDGANGILAYNYFPNTGDMVLDTGDTANFTFTSSAYPNYRLFRNTIAHEHGHGLGFNHSGPLDNSKLMEAFLNINFDGPQDDDIRGVQRNYGDRYENNDTSATANNLGIVNPAITVDNLATDGSADVDWYQFPVLVGNQLNVSLIPVGRSYNVGPQNTAGSPIDTLRINKLCLEVYASDRTTLLARLDTAPKGDPETLTGLSLAASGGTIYLRVYNSNTDLTDNIQRYKLTIDGSIAATPTTVSGIVSLQSIVNSVVPLTFEFRPQPSGTILSRSVTLDATGSYTLEGVPTGSYEVAIKGTRWLRETVALTVNQGSNTLNVALRGGDSNNSNTVDVSDLLALIARYNEVESEPGNNYSETLDFDNDRVNNISDLLILISNYNAAGDP
jgi:serralysin